MNRIRFSIFLAVAILFCGIVVFATTTITDTGTSTFGSNITLDVNQSINVSQIYLGNSFGFSKQALNRPLLSTKEMNITVCSSGCNYSTIQGALNNVPVFLRHVYRIQIKQDKHYNEDIWIPPSIISDINYGARNDGSTVGVVIEGNSSNYSSISVKSIHITSTIGEGNPTIEYLSVNGTEPTSDENVSIAVYSSGSPVFYGVLCTSSETKYCIMSYASSLTVSGVNVTTNSYRAGLLVKHDGRILTTDGGFNGTFITNAYDLQGGSIITHGDKVSAPTLVRADRGYLVDSDRDVLYGVVRFDNDTLISDSVNTTVSEISANSLDNAEALYIHSNSALFRHSDGLLYVQQASSAVTNTGYNVIKVRDEGNGSSMTIDKNGNGIALFIDSLASTYEGIRIGNIVSNKSLSIAQDDRICFNGNTCSVWMVFNGSCLQINDTLGVRCA